MSTINSNAASRGDYWFAQLTKDVTPVSGLCPSVKAADGK